MILILIFVGKKWSVVSWRHSEIKTPHGWTSQTDKFGVSKGNKRFWPWIYNAVEGRFHTGWAKYYFTNTNFLNFSPRLFCINSTKCQWHLYVVLQYMYIMITRRLAAKNNSQLSPFAVMNRNGDLKWDFGWKFIFKNIPKNLLKLYDRNCCYNLLNRKIVYSTGISIWIIISVDCY